MLWWVRWFAENILIHSCGWETFIVSKWYGSFRTKHKLFPIFTKCTLLTCLNIACRQMKLCKILFKSWYQETKTSQESIAMWFPHILLIMKSLINSNASYTGEWIHHVWAVILYVQWQWNGFNILPLLFLCPDEWCSWKHLELALLHPSHHHWLLLHAQLGAGCPIRVSHHHYIIKRRGSWAVSSYPPQKNGLSLIVPVLTVPGWCLTSSISFLWLQRASFHLLWLAVFNLSWLWTVIWSWVWRPQESGAPASILSFSLSKL